MSNAPAFNEVDNRSRWAQLYSAFRAGLMVRVTVIAALALIPVAFALDPNTLRIVVQVFLSAIIVLGAIVILGFSKQFSLGQVAIYGIGAYTMANLTATFGWPFLPALLISGAVAAMVGALIAIPGARFQGPWLALVTFAFAEIVRLLMIRLKHITGGTAGFRDIPRPEIFGFVINTELEYYYLFLVFLVAFFLLVLRLRNSPYGRIWIAIGDNPDIVASNGINVVGHKILAFATGSFIAGVAGGLFASYATFISPESFGFEHTIRYLTILVVGGLESIVGVLVSVMFFTVTHDYLAAFHPWDIILDGLVIILFMNVLPHGIGSLFNKRKHEGKRN